MMIEPREHHMMRLFGRLKPGVTLNAGVADVAGIATRFAQSYPQYYPAERAFTAGMEGLQAQLTQRVRPMPFLEACGKGSVSPHSTLDVMPQSFFVGWDQLFRRIATDDQAAVCMRARGWSYREGFDTFRPSTGD